MTETTETQAAGAERPYHHGSLRDALLGAAEATLRTQGQEELSLRELARGIGVSHGAPRRHFRDRQALLDALAITGFERLESQVRGTLDGAGEDFPSRLRATVNTFVRFATDNAALLELMFSSKHRESAEDVRAAAEPGFTLMFGLITQGQESGDVAPGDPEQVSIVLVATMQGIATLINGDMVDASLLDELTDRATDQFLRGAGPV
ncbi:MAG: TetR/AcrR family transcriptional regulator [Brachybacterium tyrofermentans]